MNYRSLFSNIRYRGLVRSAKRHYHVAEAKGYYVLFSPRDGASGNFTVMSKRGVEYVAKQLGGMRSVTSKKAFEACSRSKFITDPLAALNALYVLAGTKRARITKLAGQKLYFNVWKYEG